MMISVMWEVWEHREQLTPITQKKEVLLQKEREGEIYLCICMYIYRERKREVWGVFQKERW
jgi:hypothetical protein